MTRLAGKLLIISGILLLLAFIFQVPYLYQLLKNTKAQASSLLVPVLWRLGLILAGILLIRAGRRMI